MQIHASAACHHRTAPVAGYWVQCWVCCPRWPKRRAGYLMVAGDSLAALFCVSAAHAWPHPLPALRHPAPATTIAPGQDFSTSAIFRSFSFSTRLLTLFGPEISVFMCTECLGAVGE